MIQQRGTIQREVTNEETSREEERSNEETSRSDKDPNTSHQLTILCSLFNQLYQPSLLVSL